MEHAVEILIERVVPDPALTNGDGEGAVISTALLADKVAGGGGAAYTSSKHGVIGFTKQLRYTTDPRFERTPSVLDFSRRG